MRKEVRKSFQLARNKAKTPSELVSLVNADLEQRGGGLSSPLNPSEQTEVIELWETGRKTSLDRAIEALVRELIPESQRGTDEEAALEERLYGIAEEYRRDLPTDQNH